VVALAAAVPTPHYRWQLRLSGGLLCICSHNEACAPLDREIVETARGA
jgi:hypothetical protein